jgi:penicillin-insensitive murein DD-endopeptidase
MQTPVAIVLHMILVLFAGSIVSVGQAQADESVCYGTPEKGRLEHGVQLPPEGKNFQAYSWLGYQIGRTYVHSQVRDVVISSYEALEGTAPEKIYVYGETGWSSGGRFRPHKTHQNGLSVDFMVPITDKAGQSVPLPCSVVNKFGYEIEFDSSGKYEEYKIDFEAMAEHLYQIHKAATAQGVEIRRVIFDPALQPSLFKTKRGAYLQQHMTFSKKPSWVRHDEHYHVDFSIPCKPLDG